MRRRIELYEGGVLLGQGRLRLRERERFVPFANVERAEIVEARVNTYCNLYLPSLEIQVWVDSLEPREKALTRFRDLVASTESVKNRPGASEQG